MSPIVPLLLAALIQSPTDLPGAAPGRAHAPWTGVWKLAEPREGEALYLWFEEGRAGELRSGVPRFHRVHAMDDGDLVLESWGREQRLELEPGEDTLAVVRGDRTLLYQRAAELPEALALEPYELPEDVQVEPFLLETIQLDLRERRARDQAVRAGGRLDARAVEVDRENTAYMMELVREFGWIDAERFGKEAADAAFLLVQHTADLRLMRTALPHVEADVRAGRVDGQNFALMHDRLMLNLGYLQRYGSQIAVTADGRQVLMPLEDPERVDELRAELGMGPLAEYLALFGEEPIEQLEPPAGALR